MSNSIILEDKIDDSLFLNKEIESVISYKEMKEIENLEKFKNLNLSEFTLIDRDLQEESILDINEVVFNNKLMDTKKSLSLSISPIPLENSYYDRENNSDSDSDSDIESPLIRPSPPSISPPSPTNFLKNEDKRHLIPLPTPSPIAQLFYDNISTTSGRFSFNNLENYMISAPKFKFMERF